MKDMQTLKSNDVWKEYSEQEKHSHHHLSLRFPPKSYDTHENLSSSLNWVGIVQHASQTSRDEGSGVCLWILESRVFQSNITMMYTL
jgi:hypothetical protein